MPPSGLVEGVGTPLTASAAQGKLGRMKTALDSLRNEEAREARKLKDDSVRKNVPG